MGWKLLETRIGPQHTWAKSYVASMTHQRSPWRTHGTYVAIRIRDEIKSYMAANPWLKNIYVAAIRDGYFWSQEMGLAGLTRPWARLWRWPRSWRFKTVTDSINLWWFSTNCHAGQSMTLNPSWFLKPSQMLFGDGFSVIRDGNFPSRMKW